MDQATLSTTTLALQSQLNCSDPSTISISASIQQNIKIPYQNTQPKQYWYQFAFVTLQLVYFAIAVQHHTLSDKHKAE